MSLLPLALSAHAFGFAAWVETRRQSVGSCQFCGHEAAGWQESLSYRRDSAGEAKDVLAAACALCHLTRHLERPDIDCEAILIWLPELTQAALNRVAWRLYRTLARHGVGFDVVGVAGAGKEQAAGPSALRGELRELAFLAEKELGTSSPGDLGEVLLNLRFESHERRAQSLGGIRLLPLGRFFEGGRDVFPGLCGAAS